MLLLLLLLFYYYYGNLFITVSLFRRYLPITVHGRVSDIWRGYIGQRLMWDVGIHAAFAQPWVNQFRNPHNYLADFESEIPLYKQSGALVSFLVSWKPQTATLASRIEELYVELYERAFIELPDVLLIQAWLTSLERICFRFPDVVFS